MNTMRVTKKQVAKYIMETMAKFGSLIEFRDETQKAIDELADFPKDNAKQIKFFIRVRNDLNEMICTPKVLRVPIQTWYTERYDMDWNYNPFSNGLKEVPRPNETKYDVGDVVLIDDEGDICVGVVLGCINNIQRELRTNARGMVCFDYIRHATMEDVKAHDDWSDILEYLE